MKTKEFNVEDALNGARVVTRDGREIKFFYKCDNTSYPYRAIFEDLEGDMIHEDFTSEGTSCIINNPNVLDLFIVDEFKPKVGEVVMVKDNDENSEWYPKVFTFEYNDIFFCIDVNEKDDLHKGFMPVKVWGWDQIKPNEKSEHKVVEKIDIKITVNGNEIPLEELLILLRNQ